MKQNLHGTKQACCVKEKVLANGVHHWWDGYFPAHSYLFGIHIPAPVNGLLAVSLLRFQAVFISSLSTWWWEAFLTSRCRLLPSLWQLGSCISISSHLPRWGRGESNAKCCIFSHKVVSAGFHEAFAEIVVQFVKKFRGCGEEQVQQTAEILVSDWGCHVGFEVPRSLWVLSTGKSRWSLGSVCLSIWNLVSGNLYKALFWLKETLTHLHLAPSWLRHPQCLLFFQTPATPILKSPSTVVPSGAACLHPTSFLKTHPLESPLCKSHTLLVFVRAATSTHRRQMYYPSVVFKAWTPARLVSLWKGKLQVVSLLRLFLWYNPVSAEFLFKHSFVSRGSHEGRHDFGGTVTLGMFCMSLVAEQRAHVAKSHWGPFWFKPVLGYSL